MLALFAVQSLPVWRQSGLGDLVGKRWFFRVHEFGMLPMVYGTLAVSAVALVGRGAARHRHRVLHRRGPAAPGAAAR